MNRSYSIPCSTSRDFPGSAATRPDYSYQWAEVLSADAYGLFEEEGGLSRKAAARFRGEVLARGGSRPALESFIAFRGRAPQIDALLRHNGMSPS
jgi:oligopeptidase A